MGRNIFVQVGLICAYLGFTDDKEGYYPCCATFVIPREFFLRTADGLSLHDDLSTEWAKRAAELWKSEKGPIPHRQHLCN